MEMGARRSGRNAAGGHASDAAFDGRNPHNLWRSRPAGIFYQAIARAIAADIDDRSLAGGGDPWRVRTALAGMAGFGVRQRRLCTNLVGGIFSWRRYFAVFACGYDYLSMGAPEGANSGQRHSRSTDRDAAMVGRRLRIWILRTQDAVRNDLRRIGGGDRTSHLDGAVHCDYFPGRRVECRTGGKPQGRASYRVTNAVRVECYSGYKGD